MTAEQLIQAAAQAMKHAHAPYSKRPQGAALEAADGRIYCGASVENARLAGSSTPEIAALGGAIADGQRRFTRLAAMPRRNLSGESLEALIEFGADLEVITQADDGTIISHRLFELLPGSASFRWPTGRH